MCSSDLTELLPETARLIYKPQINRWRGNLQMQVQIEAMVESDSKASTLTITG